MAWLEITIDTAAEKIQSVVTALTAKGFADLVIEDQQEFEEFLEENRAYWDYIDEELQEKLQGLSHIKLYLEDTDQAGMARLNKAVSLLQKSGLNMTQVAEQAGFPTIRTFNRVFRKQYGCTPLEYRAQFLHPSAPK